MLDEARAFDVKLKRFSFMLETEIERLADCNLLLAVNSNHQESENIKHLTSILHHEISKTEEEIIDGIADDLDLNKGLEAVLNLYANFNEYKHALNLKHLVRAKLLMERWLTAMGLDFYQLKRTFTVVTNQQSDETPSAKLLLETRNELRRLGIARLKYEKLNKLTHNEDKVADTLLRLSDELRDQLRQSGLTVDDCSSVK